jgi:hypothetical protein
MKDWITEQYIKEAQTGRTYGFSQIEAYRNLVGKTIEFDYINYKGVKGHRKARIITFSYGSNEYHPETWRRTI